MLPSSTCHHRGISQAHISSLGRLLLCSSGHDSSTHPLVAWAMANLDQKQRVQNVLFPGGL